MKKRAHLIWIVVSLSLLQPVLRAQDVADQGITAFRNGNYDRARDLLRQAVALHPNQADPHSYLGATYLAMANQSALASEILQNAEAAASMSEADRLAAAKWVVSIPETERLAEAELRRALVLDKNNMVALQSLVDLAYHGHTELPEPEKTRRLAEGQVLYDRLTIAFADDSLSKLAEALNTFQSFAADRTGKMYAARGDLIRSSWRPILDRANRSLESTGPLPNPMRKILQDKYTSVINHGLADFQQALQFDPTNESAMIGMGSLIRDRAALLDTKEAYAGDIVTAKAWINKGFDTRDEKGRSGAASQTAQPLSPARSGVRIRVSENDQKGRLLRMLTPSYPPAAIQAHVTGSVRFTVTIDRAGRPTDAQPIGGNPILFEAARAALEQWIWRPTVANGNLVETDTEVEVRFSPN